LTSSNESARTVWRPRRDGVSGELETFVEFARDVLRSENRTNDDEEKDDKLMVSEKVSEIVPVFMFKPK